jgi:ubiquinone/menaquinone biosynthesis C-methylase UbiE
MSFDRLARIYRGMEWVLAGGKLQRCRTELMPLVSSAREVLVVGEGPGRWIEAACLHLPRARFTVVDASAAMLAQAGAAWRRAGGNAHRLRLIQARLPCALPGVEDGYDLIVTPFFLDCFAPEPLAQVVASLVAVAGPRAGWLVCDFRIPDRGLARWRAHVVLALAHWFFRCTTGISARRLTDPAPLLRNCGFVLEEERQSDWGLLSASLWRRSGHGQRQDKPRLADRTPLS